MQRRRLARAVGAKHRQHFAGGDGEFDVDAAIFDDRPQMNTSVMTGYHALAPARSRRLPSPTTTTAATATSSTDNATAASASLSRCR